jgi:hypothetical protein
MQMCTLLQAKLEQRVAARLAAKEREALLEQGNGGARSEADQGEKST